MNVNGTDSFFDVDWLGCTRYLTDSTGNTVTGQLRYDAFGEASYTLPNNWDPGDFQWGGAEWGYQAEWSWSYEPGIALQYLRNRYYDPAIGRFISADPLGFLGGLNLFTYGDNDPVMNLDPSGLRWKEWLSGLGGLVGGGLGAIEGVGFGAVPGAAGGAALGGFIDSRLDGDSVGRAVVNGAIEGGVTYAGGRLAESAVGAYQAARAARAARAAADLQALQLAEAAVQEARIVDELRSLTIAEIKKKYLNETDVKLLSKFFGTSRKGAAFRMANFEIPEGLSRATLQAYAEVARRAIAEGTDKLGVQRTRLFLIRRALAKLPLQ